MTRIDIAIIGSGPAGLSAALTAKNRNKTIQVFGSADLSSKMQVIAHPITNFLGLSNVTGKEMAQAFERQMMDASITVDTRKVTSVYAMGDYFALQLSDGDYVESSTVILASGVTAGKPYVGESEYLGRGVSYCATCDAPLFKGKNVVVIGGSKSEEVEAEFLGEVCNHVTYIPLYKEEPVFKHKNIEVLNDKPMEIVGAMKVNAIKLTSQTIETDGVFILREAQFPSQLVPGLETDGSAVKVNRNMETNIAGLYAAGDITGLPYQFMKSAGEGNVAAISAATYIDKKKREM